MLQQIQTQKKSQIAIWHGFICLHWNKRLWSQRECVGSCLQPHSFVYPVGCLSQNIAGKIGNRDANRTTGPSHSLYFCTTAQSPCSWVGRKSQQQSLGGGQLWTGCREAGWSVLPTPRHWSWCSWPATSWGRGPQACWRWGHCPFCCLLFRCRWPLSC